MSSILNDVKHLLGLNVGDNAFDADIIILINSQLANLNQIGAGPNGGYQITSASNQWEEFVSDVKLNSVKTYVYLGVKMIFDPPQSGYTTSAMERQLQELTFRINTAADYG